MLTVPGIAYTLPASQNAQDENVEFEADQLTYDSETGEIRALGQVVLIRNGYILKAGEVRYNEKTGKAEAIGAVELTSPDGDTIFSPKVVLENELRDAVVEDIKLLLEDGARVYANAGQRDGEDGITTLDRAVYSPCKICNDSEGNPKDPFWQIKAVKVVHNRGKKRLYYENATLEILGIPILWTPYFSHPDPTVDRASGFLPLEIRTSNNLGIVAGLPYYHVIDKTQDFTITPTITTREGLVLSGEYRHKLSYGEYTVDGSITYTDERDANNNLTGDNEFRGHISSQGQFNHAGPWRSTYQLNFASDDTYLRRYGFSRADTLTSEYNLEGFFDRSYISGRTLLFQELRNEVRPGLTPLAVPIIEAEYIPKFKPLGGTIKLGGNALSIVRTGGLDTQRLSLSAGWKRRWIGNNGLVFDLDGLVRSDAYNIDNVAEPDNPFFAGTFGSGEGGTDFRNVARLTGTFSYPLVKQTGSGFHTLEPIIQITASPSDATPNSIVNEDSRAFELNDLNLFSSERAAGFDLFDESSRVTVGVRWQYESKDLQSDILIGQSFRIDGQETFFLEGAGLEGDFSDIVGRTNIRYKDWLEIDHRYRLDDTSLSVRRNDVNALIGSRKTGLEVGYFRLDRELDLTNPILENAVENRQDREELRLGLYYQINDNWRFTGTAIEDLTNGANGVEYEAGVSYIDECIEIGLQIRETFTQDRDIEPGTSILFRFKLLNLG
ncbi:LPS-assembly protein LptD [Kordiimonas sp. SCSIO 12610]|uniref:LPS-assembly protein LptD n=1 Tax=Kordiimonas sp. SCSIO 12610 TaxID=2829597 RepID=UPI00210A2438|nr:LPS assembly protein LptD [Kordiimonas sp. SCSIO 12610]UTW53876.1 LPS-assembly protein LptD [Kordiimonas sp. SCSIO 12610]